VTIPSQLRYVGYFDRFISQYFNATPRRTLPTPSPTIMIDGFKLRPKADFDVGGGCDPYCRIYVEGKEIYNMKKVLNKIKPWRKEPSIELKCRVPVSGDVRVVFMDKDAVGKGNLPALIPISNKPIDEPHERCCEWTDDKMFSFWFNTSFIDTSLPLILSKKELDGAVKDKKEAHFPKNFECEVNFEVEANPNSIFGVTIDRCMTIQASSHPELKVPRIVTTMIDAVRTRGGYGVEGIFRISAVKDDLDGLKKQIDSGDYDIKTPSPHIPAGMLKQWMRELAEPLIPTSLYNDAITAARNGSGDDAMKVVKQVAPTTRAILDMLAAMSSEISNDTNKPTSRMGIENLAIVFAPSFLRYFIISPAHLFSSFVILTKLYILKRTGILPMMPNH
jgi:hypothetical protein